MIAYSIGSERLTDAPASPSEVFALLDVDELGYVPLSQVGAELLFEVFSQRYERGSIVVTSNLPFEEWPSVFRSERLTGALLDRLTHHVHILEMNGDSYRLKQSAKRRTAPRAEPNQAISPQAGSNHHPNTDASAPEPNHSSTCNGRSLATALPMRALASGLHYPKWPEIAPPHWPEIQPPLTKAYIAKVERLLDRDADVPDGLYGVGRSLYIRVRDSSRTWMVRWGKPTQWMSLGSVWEVSLSEADRGRTVALGMVAKGIDPRTVAMTFEAATGECLRAHEHLWTDPRYAINLRRLLQRHPPRFQEEWEVAALAELGDAQLNRAGAGLPVAVAVAGALNQALGALLTIAGAGQLPTSSSINRSAATALRGRTG